MPTDTELEERYVEYMRTVAAGLPADMPYEEKRKSILEALEGQYRKDMDSLADQAQQELGPLYDAALVAEHQQVTDNEHKDQLDVIRQGL